MIKIKPCGQQRFPLATNSPIGGPSMVQLKMPNAGPALFQPITF